MIGEIATASWWESLKHGGLLISPAYVSRFFGDDPPTMSPWLAEQLRRQVTRFQAGESDALAPLLDVVLEKVAALDSEQGTWVKGTDVGTEWTRRAITGEAVRPRRLFRGPSGEIFPVFVADEPRLGIGKGARPVSRVLEWLRKGDEKIALITNGSQWRLLYAGIDFDAWAEWESDLWFEEGAPGPQVDALRMLLAPRAIRKTEGELPRLLTAIEESRKGQAELSAELGNRVRKAVERLAQAHAAALDEAGGSIDRKDIYLAAVRVVMRMVVILFAEARRDLLPLDRNQVYYDSYSLQGLRESLRRSSGGGRLERLRHQFGAWPRMLGLFDLIYQGSPHELLQVPRYGGDLFRPGDPNSEDGVSRALHIFENACFRHEVSDAVVFEIIENITTTHVRVRQGRTTRSVAMPVNFSDLSSEYIGMLYEGLLGYELRKAPHDDAIIVLALGDQPALPLTRLEAMDDEALSSLVEKFKKKSGPALAAGDAEEDEEENEEEELDDEESAGEDEETPEDEDEAEVADEGAEEESDEDVRQHIRERARAWAARAVVAGKLVKAPRSRKSEAVEVFEKDVHAKASGLTRERYLPGEYYLVRASGTRKGSGTFYTRPQLAIPTAHRTLRPLAYVAPPGEDGEPNELAPHAEWTPRKPEEILALKVCDPACGSGSFLVAALRFLTDALYASLHHHGRIAANGEQSLVTLAEGKESTGALAEETLPSRPEDPQFEERLKARLKRYVVERCIYGVDFDMLAVELARLALWIETMDRALPFEFLDHKIKTGNSLIGCWLDRFQHYPAMAFKGRETGDAKHENGVHFEQGTFTVRLKEFTTQRVVPDLASFVKKPTLFDEDKQIAAIATHLEALAALEQVHDLPIHESEERARRYRESFTKSEAWLALRAQFDVWSACWFWQGEAVDDAPLPSELLSPQLRTIERARKIARQMRFFHWELEFPDVFSKNSAGFDAIIGNPPWETLQPNSQEFFSQFDPLYRSYGQTRAKQRQTELFHDESIESAWIEFNAGYAGYAQWMKYSSNPWGDPQDAEASPDRFALGRGNKNLDLHDSWRWARSRSKGYASTPHPFRYQGEGKAYTYKLFLELSHSLLREGGRLGMIVPSGIYSDKGTTVLRQLFLNSCRWRWLFSFENRAKIFDIHRSFKFNPVIVEKGGTTTAILTAFMRRELKDWVEAERYGIPYLREQIKRLSPKSGILLEIECEQDAQILSLLAKGGQALGHQISGTPLGIEGTFQGDINLSSPEARRLLIHSSVLIKDAAARNLAGWILSDASEEFVPILQGAMISHFDPMYQSYSSGFGRNTVWSRSEWSFGGAQFWGRPMDFREAVSGGARLLLRRVINVTNARSMTAAVVPSIPSSDTTLVAYGPQEWKLREQLIVATVMNSFAFDWQARLRISGGTGATALDFARIEELLVPVMASHEVGNVVCREAASMNLAHACFAREWLTLRAAGVVEEIVMYRNPRSRFRAAIVLNAIVAFCYGLDRQGLRWILRDCEHPQVALVRSLLWPKGFWRVDKEREPRARRTVLTLLAFDELQERAAAASDISRAVQEFASQADGWQLPLDISLGDSNESPDVSLSWERCERYAAHLTDFSMSESNNAGRS